MAHILVRQQQLDLFDALAEASHRFIRQTAKTAKLVRQKSTRKADVEAAAADRVEHADFAGQLQRMIEDRQHGASHQARAACALGRGGEKQHRVGAVAAIVVKVMLDDANMRESELFRLLREVERVAKIVGTGFLIRSDIRKKLHAKLHFGPSQARTLPTS